MASTSRTCRPSDPGAQRPTERAAPRPPTPSPPGRRGGAGRAPPAEDPAAGLYENEDGFAADDEDQSVALLQDEVPGTLSAEEAAVHLVDEADAVTYGGLDLDGPVGDGYVDPADT